MKVAIESVDLRIWKEFQTDGPVSQNALPKLGPHSSSAVYESINWQNTSQIHSFIHLFKSDN